MSMKLKTRRRKTRNFGSFTAKPLLVAALVSCSLFALTTAGMLTARSQDRAPGLTGLSHPDDLVMARQLLMDGIDNEMHDIDIATTGKEFKLDELQAHANSINTMLMAFPHLFPPQTKPAPAADGSPSVTLATPAIWQDFEDFYGKAQAAATVAFDASQADTLAKFNVLGKKLREACDSCHAKYMHVDPPPQP